MIEIIELLLLFLKPEQPTREISLSLNPLLISSLRLECLDDTCLSKFFQTTVDSLRIVGKCVGEMKRLNHLRRQMLRLKVAVVSLSMEQ